MSQQNRCRTVRKIPDVYKWINAKTTEKWEYKNHSWGSSIIPVDNKKELNKPFLPKRGIQETILITFEVQKGIVQIKNNVICKPNDLTWKAKKYAIVNPANKVNSQDRKQK